MSQTSTSRKKMKHLTGNEIILLLKESFVSFIEKKAFFHGASLAYYTLFALIPLIYLTVSFLGQILGSKVMIEVIVEILENHVGIKDVDSLFGFVHTLNFNRSNFYMELIGVITFMLSISAIFVSLKTSINEFFRVNYTPTNVARGLLRNVLFRLLSIGFMIVFSLLFVGLYFLQMLMMSLGEKFLGNHEVLYWFFQYFVDHVLAIIILWFIFIIIFKYIHDCIVPWRVAVFGGLFTAILLYVGQLAIKYYLSNHFFASNAGLAGGLLVILAWLFYSAQLLFFGANLAYIYSKATHQKIKHR